MNWDQIEGNWKQWKGRTRQKWGKLTKDDLDIARGSRERITGKLQERYGIAREEAQKQIDSFLAAVDNRAPEKSRT